jgi:hypothetical protein
MAYYYKGAGKVYLGKYDGTTGLMQVGNVSELMISVNEKEDSLKDFDSAAGGEVMTVTTIDKIEVSMTMNDLNTFNMAIALWGASSVTNAGTATAEVGKAYKGGLIELDYINPSTVTLTDNSGTVTYTAGTDYTVSGVGLFIPTTSTIVDGTTVKATYNYPLQNVVEALTTGATEYRVVLDGINIANSNKPVSVQLYKVKFAPSKNMNFKGDAFGELKLTGSLLQDDTITASGKSKYFKEVMIP